MPPIRYGVQVHRSPHGTPLGVDEIVELAARMEAAGLDSLWLTQGFDHDCLTTLAVVGAMVPRIELGSAVVPTPPRHPGVLALQALTVQSVLRGRLALGIGTSHRQVMADAFDIDVARPAAHMEGYLDTLLPLVRAEPGGVEIADGTIDRFGGVSGAREVPILVGAMGTRLVELAGRRAEGVITALVGPRGLAEHIGPTLFQQASAAGRPRPRVVVCLPACVTSRVGTVRDLVDQEYAASMRLPTYQRNLGWESAGSAADLAIVGDQSDVAARFEQLVQAGATDIAVRLVGSADERSATVELLAELVSRRAALGE